VTQVEVGLDEENARVCEALRFVSVDIKSVYDLVNTSARYDDAIPILIGLLPEVRHPRIREGIARALTVKEAAAMTPELIREFLRVDSRTPQEESAKWAIGNAIATTARERDIPDVIRLMADTRHGITRAMLPLALGRTKTHKEEAITALLSALNDDELVPQAARMLAKMAVTEAVAPLRRLLLHQNKDIQIAATKALKRLSPELLK
jgi:HEAT repeat protein